jgi:protein-disulfide isomerase
MTALFVGSRNCCYTTQNKIATIFTIMTDQSQLTKKERQEQKKAAKAQERTRQQLAAQRTKLLQWGAGILAVAAVIGFFVWVGGGSGSHDGREWFKGNNNAPVTLIEYSDFQCPACASYYPLVKELHEEFGDNLKIVYRHYPLTQIHPYAQPAAHAAEAAGRQGKFWEMHDKLFDNQRGWASATATQVDETFLSYAEDLGLDLTQFENDMSASKTTDAVAADRAAGNRTGVRGTPTFVLQGEVIDNPQSYDQFRNLIIAAFNAAGADPYATPVDTAATTTAAVHKHADFAVYIRGQEVDFSQEKYQSHGHVEGEEGDEHDDGEVSGNKHQYLHLHDGNGEIIHQHATGYTLADFFGSIGVTLTNDCITLDTGEEYCENDLETLTGMVNGERVADIAGYEFADEDRIVVSFGNERALDEEMANVTDIACIYSETCPERGEAPDEACVGGIGTACE